jgi:hypothetical protein
VGAQARGTQRQQQRRSIRGTIELREHNGDRRTLQPRRHSVGRKTPKSRTAPRNLLPGDFVERMAHPA